MRICGRIFAENDIETIKQLIKADPNQSRRKLSQQICKELNWCDAKGNLKEMNCRKVLQEMKERGIIELAAREFLKGVEEQTEPFQFKAGIQAVNCTLEGLGEIKLQQVAKARSEEGKGWNWMMKNHHDLGMGPLCGAQLRYVLKSSQYGWLGGMAFSSGTWHLKVRDKKIGWSERARRENLHKVITNSRFLILPQVKVRNLASHVLGMAMKQIESDWEAQYGYSPVLVETFVDERYYTGASYYAANWEPIGESSGRYESATGKSKKTILIYPLQKDWQEQLCRESKRPFGYSQRTEAPKDWVEREFGGIDVYDERIKRRLYTVARSFYNRPGRTIPETCKGDVAQTIAAYRLLDNEQLTKEVLLQSPISETINRMKSYKVVLAVQDTTTLNYTKYPSIEGLGPLNTKKDRSVGVHLHDTLAFTVEGKPLGVLDIQDWVRPPFDPAIQTKADKKKKNDATPISNKESNRWLKSYQAACAAQQLCPDTMVVSVGDRESDIYELFDLVVRTPGGAQLLVRASKACQRVTDGINLWEYIEKQPVAGIRTITVPLRKGFYPSREAQLEIRFAQCTIRPPRDKKGLAAITPWLVHAREINAPPEVKEPIDWLLITTVPVHNYEDAVERMRWYETRWCIEIYHRILKSGCRIEERRLDTIQKIERALMIDIVIAWRIFFINRATREDPGQPCDSVFSTDEWVVLFVHMNHIAPPDSPPPLSLVTNWLARLGGYLGRKSDPQPGTTVIWRGLLYLAAMIEGFKLAQALFEPSIRGDPRS